RRLLQRLVRRCILVGRRVLRRQNPILHDANAGAKKYLVERGARWGNGSNGTAKVGNRRTPFPLPTYPAVRYPVDRLTLDALLDNFTEGRQAPEEAIDRLFHALEVFVPPIEFDSYLV